MNSTLSAIPAARRRHLAALLGLFGALFLAVGAVALTGNAPGAVRVFAAVALTGALLLGLTAWGVAASVRMERSTAQLDAVIEESIAGLGDHEALRCGCGGDHDPDEMHVRGTDPDAAVDATAASCPASGQAAGAVAADCPHSCAACVLTGQPSSP